MVSLVEFPLSIWYRLIVTYDILHHRLFNVSPRYISRYLDHLAETLLTSTPRIAQNPVDKFGSVTVVDLCVDTGAPAAFWGHPFTGGQTGGLAVANITQVDCDEWDGSLDRFSSWTRYQAMPGDDKKVELKPGHAS